MKKNVYKLLFLFAAYLIYQSSYAIGVRFELAALEISGTNYRIEIADTPLKRQRGLMYRQSLDSKSGMIFVYQEEGDNRIWMKNTFIPLTVIWLDNEARVIGVKKLMPCKQENCPIYGVNKRSKYVIEFNETFDILKVGDLVPSVLLLGQ